MVIGRIALPLLRLPHVHEPKTSNELMRKQKELNAIRAAPGLLVYREKCEKGGEAKR